MALDEAKLAPHEIDVVASAQSGITAFDAAELRGIRAICETAPIAAPKAIFGETCGAGGALAMACALAWFSGVPVAPLVEGSLTSVRLRHVLVLAVGYYGNASAVILRNPEHP
jgi:3-oxoacyl-(acyl-carrier-protein) synthase